MEQRKALGRGLASLIPGVRASLSNALTQRQAEKKEAPVFEKPASPLPSPIHAQENSPALEGPYRKIPVERIALNPHQPRRQFAPEALQELSDSIRERGLIIPLLVTIKGQGYELISGERRLRASKMAGLKEVPVIIREEELSGRMITTLIENIQRENLNPIEEALGYKDLMVTCDWTQEDVADKVGRNRASVANALRLLKLPPKIQDFIQGGTLSVGHAKVLLSIPEIERQLYWADQIVKKHWSVRELEENLATHVRPLAKAGVPTHQKEVLTAQQKSVLDGLRQSLGTQVRLKGTDKKGQLIIDYYSLEDLNRIYQQITRSSGL